GDIWLMSGAAIPPLFPPPANGAAGVSAAGDAAAPPLPRIASTPISAPAARPAMPHGKPTRHPVAGAEVLAPHLWQYRAPSESVAPQALHVIVRAI
ncbi:MAG TPA: hypothetical protein VFK92_18215, partial [Burkholderiales bacterium]|nr:hypothetical protein [Burkholderiales bacterium]